ncbi:hypothetical protein XENTR_v10007054 [Xenopus tropicalis]|nr:hypothetical protein XENTR_v10007054 [Xenopus tropicalis]
MSCFVQFIYFHRDLRCSRFKGTTQLTLNSTEKDSCPVAQGLTLLLRDGAFNTGAVPQLHGCLDHCPPNVGYCQVLSKLKNVPTDMDES